MAKRGGPSNSPIFVPHKKVFPGGSLQKPGLAQLFSGLSGQGKWGTGGKNKIFPNIHVSGQTFRQAFLFWFPTADKHKSLGWGNLHQQPATSSVGGVLLGPHGRGRNLGVSDRISQPNLPPTQGTKEQLFPRPAIGRKQRLYRIWGFSGLLANSSGAFFQRKTNFFEGFSGLAVKKPGVRPNRVLLTDFQFGTSKERAKNLSVWNQLVVGWDGAKIQIKKTGGVGIFRSCGELKAFPGGWTGFRISLAGLDQKGLLKKKNGRHFGGPSGPTGKMGGGGGGGT